MQGAADPLSEAIARMLRELRRRHGLSQAQVAAALGRDQSLVSRLESGARRVTVDDFLLVAAAAGASFKEVTEELARAWEFVPHPESIWARESEGRRPDPDTS
jgi:transcriptional regulator with XRE-family HTH domain